MVALIARLKNEGVQVVAVEQTERAVEYRAFEIQGDTAFIFGNEVTGVETEVLDACDAHIEIPMSGIKESLNVSVCVGVILFAFRQ